MHGLINKAIELFVTQTYGADTWRAVMSKADLGWTEFEAMLPYNADVTRTVVDAMQDVLGRPGHHILEDFGTFLVISPVLPGVRRLLRFAGVDYIDFLHSLEDLPGRVSLAVGDLNLPALILTERGENGFALRCQSGLAGYGYVMMGVLRAMADDYGTLAMLDMHSHPSGDDLIDIEVVQDSYASAKSFALGAVHV